MLSNSVNSNRLKDQYIINNFRPTGHKSSSPLDSALMVDWVSLWTPLESNYYNLPYPGQTIFGKSYKNRKLQDKIIFQHFIPENYTNDPRSPSKKQNTFVECSGCSFNIDHDTIRSYTSRSIQYGNIIESDLPQIIGVTYFFSVNS